MESDHTERDICVLSNGISYMKFIKSSLKGMFKKPYMETLVSILCLDFKELECIM